MLLTSLALAAASTPTPAFAQAAAAAEASVGTNVVDTAGGTVGTVTAVQGEGFGMFSGGAHLMLTGETTQAALQDCLAPGRYELRLTSDAVRAKPLIFEIRANETTQASWKIEK